MAQSNFSFLTGGWAFLADDAVTVEKYALSDARAAAIYGRRALELGMKWIFKNDKSINDPYETNLAAMVNHREFKAGIKKGLSDDIRFLWKLGNFAAHDAKTIPIEQGMGVAQALHSYLGWLTRVYTKNGTAPAPFNRELLPKPQGVQNLSLIHI